jgi:hypothetical protein
MAPIPIVAIQQKSERMAQNMTAVVVDSNSGLDFESKDSQKRYLTKRCAKENGDTPIPRRGGTFPRAPTRKEIRYAIHHRRKRKRS